MVVLYKHYEKQAAPSHHRANVDTLKTYPTPALYENKLRHCIIAQWRIIVISA
jgi:hypothetical protein